MRFETYHFEVKDLLTQFCNAFDSIVIKRFNQNKDVIDRVNVRYVYAPKERVLYDLVNKAQNIDLPCVAISITNFSRDESRVFNKLDGFYKNSISKSYFYHTPVPVNIGVSMSIIAKYQTDLDQIISNFVPYTNPYIIISWTVPEEIQLPNLQEIRTEVLWSNDISVEYPTDIGGSEKYRVTATTNFTIKGYLFKNDNNPVSNIYAISANFHSIDDVNLENYDNLASLNKKLSAETETVVLTALPAVSEVTPIEVYSNIDFQNNVINVYNIPKIVLYGEFYPNNEQLELARHVFLSANTDNVLPLLSAYDYYDAVPSLSALYPTLTAYEITSNGGTVIYNDKNIEITLPPLSSNMKFDILVSNEAGYKKYYSATSTGAGFMYIRVNFNDYNDPCLSNLIAVNTTTASMLNNVPITFAPYNTITVPVSTASDNSYKITDIKIDDPFIGSKQHGVSPGSPYNYDDTAYMFTWQHQLLTADLSQCSTVTRNLNYFTTFYDVAQRCINQQDSGVTGAVTDPFVINYSRPSSSECLFIRLQLYNPQDFNCNSNIVIANIQDTTNLNYNQLVFEQYNQVNLPIFTSSLGNYTICYIKIDSNFITNRTAGGDYNLDGIYVEWDYNDYDYGLSACSSTLTQQIFNKSYFELANSCVSQQSIGVTGSLSDPFIYTLSIA